MASESLKVVYDVLKNEKKGDDSDSIEPKDFFWDQFLKYISSAILALTVLNVSVDFLRDGGVKCFPPADTATFLTNEPVYSFGRDHASYLNNYCAKSVPVTEYFPIYILVHGIFLVAPHYIWHAVFKGDFDSFFAIAEKFDRLRSSETGEYQEKNFDRVKKLEEEYGGTKRRIFDAYIFKLFAQLCVCIGSVIFSARLFIDFSFSFECPGSFETKSIPDGWPLNTTIVCVFTSLRLLRLVRYADFILNALAGALALIGLGWCFIRHTRELGNVEIARFSFQACLVSERFIFPPKFSWPSYPWFVKYKERGPQWFRILMWIFTHYPRVHMKNIFSPQIKSDLDFLVMRLFRADSSHGKVFKDIQINKELKSLIGRDHQLLHLYINIQQDMNAQRHVPSDRQVFARLRKQDYEENKQEEENGCCSCLRRFFKRTAIAGGQDRHDAQNPMFSNGSVDEPDQGGDSTTGEQVQRGSQNPVRRSAGNTNGSGATSQTSQRSEAGQEQVDIVMQRVQQQTNVQPATEGEIHDFHQLFLDSGFSIQNPERLAYNYFKPYLGNLDFHADDFRGIRDWIYWFVALFGPKTGSAGAQPGSVQRPSNQLAIDISFGSIGYSLVLARPFKRVLSVNFDAFFRGRGSGEDFEIAVMDEFYTNYSTVKFPHDIFTQQNVNINDVNDMVIGFANTVRQKFDFLVVGPITEESKRVSVNLLINLMYTAKVIKEGALLLAVRPLKVGSQKLSTHYYKYEPSKQLFDHGIQEEEIAPKLRDIEQKKKGTLWRVDKNEGIQFLCGKVPCVFEFSAYRYRIPSNVPTADKNSFARSPPGPVVQPANVALPNNNTGRDLSVLLAQGSQIVQPANVANVANVALPNNNTGRDLSVLLAQGSQQSNIPQTVQNPALPISSNQVYSQLHSQNFAGSQSSGPPPNIPVAVVPSSNAIAANYRPAARIGVAAVTSQLTQLVEPPGHGDLTDCACSVNTSQLGVSATVLQSHAVSQDSPPPQNRVTVHLDKNIPVRGQTSSAAANLEPARSINTGSELSDTNQRDTETSWIPLKKSYTKEQIEKLKRFPIARPPRDNVMIIESPILENEHELIEQPKLDLADPHSDNSIGASQVVAVQKTNSKNCIPTAKSPSRKNQESSSGKKTDVRPMVRQSATSRQCFDSGNYSSGSGSFTDSLSPPAESGTFSTQTSKQYSGSNFAEVLSPSTKQPQLDDSNFPEEVFDSEQTPGKVLDDKNSRTSQRQIRPRDTRIKSQMSLNHEEMFDQILLQGKSTSNGGDPDLSDSEV